MQLSRWLHALPIERRAELEPVDVDAGGIVTIPCGGARHSASLTDRDGLALDDHDVEAELAMMVFGASVPSCLLYRAAWDGAFTDTFLAEWAADVDGDRITATREDWYGNYWESWPAVPAAARVLFGPGVQRALAMRVAPRWAERGGPEGPGSGLTAVRHAVALRARRALVMSLASVDAHRRPDALVPVSLTVAPAGQPLIRGTLSRVTSHISLHLPATWLWDVWARSGGLDRSGRFVIARDTSVEWLPTGGPHREHEATTVSLRDAGSVR